MRIQELDDDALRGLCQLPVRRTLTSSSMQRSTVPHSHGCESHFADALLLTSSQRAQITLQTKCRTVDDGSYFDSSYEHILWSVEESLRALRTDYVDISCCIGPASSSSRAGFRNEHRRSWLGSGRRWRGALDYCRARESQCRLGPRSRPRVHGVCSSDPPTFQDYTPASMGGPTRPTALRGLS